MNLAISISFSFVGVLIAFLGGALSIISPCVLPILPGLAGITTGMSLEELENDKKLYRRVAAMCAAFSLGFSVVFVIVGLATTEIGQKLSRNEEQLTMISGWILIILSIFFLLSFYTKFAIFNFEKKFKFKNSLSSVPVVLIGAGFALGWSPCLGPVLAGVYTVANTESSLIGRIIILVAYCVGLCLAMSAAIIASLRFKKVLTFIKKHTRLIVNVTFVLMFAFGLILIFDNMEIITKAITDFFDLIGLDKIANGI